MTYSKGCNICDKKPPGFPNSPCGYPHPPGPAPDTRGIAAAVKAAEGADVAILFLGGDQTTEAESFDRVSLTLPGAQQQLLEAVVRINPQWSLHACVGLPLFSISSFSFSFSCFFCFLFLVSFPLCGSFIVVVVVFSHNVPVRFVTQLTVHRVRSRPGRLPLPSGCASCLLFQAAVHRFVVLVLINGGPVDVSWAKASPAVRAILEGFEPGELGGDAFIDLIIGAAAPSGKLPYTVYPESYTARDPREVDLRAAGGTTYQFYQGQPVWPFGWGLAYTTFSYEWSGAGGSDTHTHVLSTADAMGNVSGGGGGGGHALAEHRVRVTNTGDVASDCVVLAFVAMVTTPVSPKAAKHAGGGKFLDFVSSPTRTAGSHMGSSYVQTCIRKQHRTDRSSFITERRFAGLPPGPRRALEETVWVRAFGSHAARGGA